MGADGEEVEVASKDLGGGLGGGGDGPVWVAYLEACEAANTDVLTELGDAVGMAFRFDEARIGTFYMFQTPTPLSIAWFDAPVARAGGALVSTADMEPCVSKNSTECERFSAEGDYVLAIEVFQGDLASIGITAGSTARLLPGTESTNCPLG